MIFSIIITPLWSAYTEAYAKNDIKWIRNTIKKVINIWALLLLFVILMLVFSSRVYELWVGKSIQIPFLLSLVLAFYVIINAWCGIFSQFLNGIGKIKLQLYSGLFGALIHIPLAIFLGNQIGISGVVLSTCLLGLISALWSPIQYYKIITGNAKGIWNK